jgi:hypothetical protein
MLPRALAERWAGVSLPKWVAECCGLPVNASVGALAMADLPNDPPARAAVEFFLAELMRSRASEIAVLQVFPPYVELTSDVIARADWSTRVRTALTLHGFKDNLTKLAHVTYGQLFRVRNLGMKSVIEIGLWADTVSGHPQPVDQPAQRRILLDEKDVESLRALAHAEWADLIFHSDPRFSDLVPNDRQSVTLAGLAEALLLGVAAPTGSSQLQFPFAVPFSASDPASIHTWLSEVTARAATLDAMPLENLLSDYLERVSNFRGARLEAILARLGWSGKAPITLEEAGKLLNVTRERIRQLEDKVRKKFPTTPALMPAVIRALDKLVEVSPIETDKAAALLAKAGISRAAFSPEGLIAAAEDLGIDSPIQIVSAKGLQMVTRAANTAHVAAILKAARRKAGASGVVSSMDVAMHVTQETKVECTEAEVAKTLEASRRFRRIHESWYWATDIVAGRNRLINVCRGMLSVTSPLSVSSLRDGVKREYTFRNLSYSGRYDLRVPPTDVLRAFLRDHPDFVVTSEDQVRYARTLDYRQELGQSDQVLVDVLRSSASTVLDRATILQQCVERGVNLQTASVGLSYSCIAEHVDTNIWTLRGADINPAAVEALRRANALRPRERRVRDFGWTPGGNLWVAAVIPPLVQTFVFGSPPGARSYVAGQKFAAFMHDGIPCGTIGITEDGTVYGFGTFQQISSCEPGDILVVEFNLSDRKATLILGDEELLDLYGSE